MLRLTVLALCVASLCCTMALSATEKVLLCMERKRIEQMATIAQVFGFKASEVIVDQLVSQQSPSDSQACSVQDVDVEMFNSSPLVTVYPALHPDNQARFGVLRLLLGGTYYYGATMFMSHEQVESLSEVAAEVLARVGAILPAPRMIETPACLLREDIELVAMTRQVSGFLASKALLAGLMKPHIQNALAQCFTVRLNLEKIPASSVMTMYPGLKPGDVTSGIVEVPLRDFSRAWAVIQFNAVPQPTLQSPPVAQHKMR